MSHLRKNLIYQNKRICGTIKRRALKENIEVFILGATEAEAVKLFSNTYLALRVACFNELDTFAQSKGLNTRYSRCSADAYW